MGMFGPTQSQPTSPVPTGGTASGGMSGPITNADDYLSGAYAKSAQQGNGFSRSMQHHGQGGF